MFSGLFFTSFLAVLIIISQRNEIEFGVIFYDYNICHILTFNTSHTDIIQTHTKPTLKNTFTTKLAF